MIRMSKRQIVSTISEYEVLNLFSGIGGNRKLWSGPVKVTSVENDSEIAAVYKKLFPGDELIEMDAIKFVETIDLTDFDIIVACPPCTTHSTFSRFQGVKVPDLKTLYGLKIYFDYNFGGKYIIENVNPWYSMPIKPNAKLGRHYIWSNFYIPRKEFPTTDIKTLSRKQLLRLYDFDENLELPGDKLRKRQIVRNCLEPEIGLYLLQQAMLETQSLEVFQ